MGNRDLSGTPHGVTVLYALPRQKNKKDQAEQGYKGADEPLRSLGKPVCYQFDRDQSFDAIGIDQGKGNDDDIEKTNILISATDRVIEQFAPDDIGTGEQYH